MNGTKGYGQVILDHLWQKFAEILLFLLTLAFVVASYIGYVYGHNVFADAMLDNNKTVIGALLMLLTKAASNMLSRSTDQGGDSTSVTSTVTSSVVKTADSNGGTPDAPKAP